MFFEFSAKNRFYPNYALHTGFLLIYGKSTVLGILGNPTVLNDSRRFQITINKLLVINQHLFFSHQ